MTAPSTPQPEPLYPTRAGAGSFLGRQVYQRMVPPVVVLGVSPTGVEVGASAAKAMSCPFDVVVGAHIRMEGLGTIGAVAEDGDAVTDPEFAPRFGMMEALDAAIDKARRSIKNERTLFRGPRPLQSLQEKAVVIVDGHLISPWKVLAAAEVAKAMGASRVGVAAAVSTQQVQERVRARKFDFICPSVLLEAAGHARPFGDPQDPSAERLRSIILARQAA